MAAGAASLLAKLRSLGVSVRVERGRLLARPLASVPEALRAELRARRSDVVEALGVVGALRARYDDLLEQFRQFPDTPEAVASPEWSHTVAELNRILVDLDAARCPATDEEVVCGFSGLAPRSAREPR
jgi:hypothetical protein